MAVLFPVLLIVAASPMTGSAVSLETQAIDPQSISAHTVDVLPLRPGEGAQSLNGEWRFKYLPSIDVGADEGFFEPACDVSAWKTIPVPSHWELQGFAEPEYEDEVKEGTGLYRRTFRIDKPWQGQRVFLRFDGVLYGFRVYVNGKAVGEWASSFNPATFDITDALQPGEAENVIAVRVTTRSKGWNFDNMDCWALSGIYRDVTLFVLPEVHLKDYTAQTTLTPSGAARLHVDIVASASGTVSGVLLTPNGKSGEQFKLDLGPDGRGSTDVIVNQPDLWTAETPSLYRLQLDLKSGGQVVQRYTDRIGLRQITTDGGILKLNGTPIKLRGIDHHDIWPDAGRVASEEKMRHDLELIRAANINFIRTSHYPHPGFVEMCDEMGIYVDEEVPYIHGRKWLKDPDYQEVLLNRARATVMRDKNRPSIIFWTCGNENPVTTLGNNTGRYVKALDPSRPFTFPTIGSQFEGFLGKFPENMELYAAHYPSLKQARHLSDTLQRPIVFTEYAHQRGLSRAGVSVQDLWEVFYHSPRIAGGAVWLFQDQGLLRTTADRNSVKDGDLMAWLDDHQYYDTHGFYAMDGIVYSDRTPQVDYWQVRKVYSPVQIAERVLKIEPGVQSLMLHVENRYDFCSLAGIRLKWSLLRNGLSLENGAVALSAKPKETETAPIPVHLPASLAADIYTFGLRCEDESGRSFYERSIRLDPAAAGDARWNVLRSALVKSEPVLEVSDPLISVIRANYHFQLDRHSGQAALFDTRGATIVGAFGPHVGRHPTINDLGKDREHEASIWRGDLMTELTELTTDARQTPQGIQITVGGAYSRPGKPEELIRGQYELLFEPDGAIEITYRYTPGGASGDALEAGFALELPATMSEFRWLGQGPYAGYPGKDRLNEYGIYHLNREDLYFPGNRREVEFASLANPSGAGILLAGARMTVDLENQDQTTILSQLSLVPGENGAREDKADVEKIGSRLKVDSIKEIAGKFTLLPLDASWPEPLAKWLGPPSELAKPNKPFLRSYDQ